MKKLVILAAVIVSLPLPAAAQCDATANNKAVSAITLAPRAKTATELAAQRRLEIVGSRAQMLDAAAGGGGTNNSNANYTRGESVYFFRNGPSPIRNLVLVFGNYALGPYENSNPVNNPITVEAAISPQDPRGAPQVARVTFGGKVSVAIDPDGEVSSDPVGYYVPAFGVVAIRTGVTVASGQTWPVGYLSSTNNEGAVASSSATSQIMTTSSGFTTPSGGVGGQIGYGPVALLGEMDAPALSISAIGDSLTVGNTGAFFGDGRGNRGVLGYGFANVNGGQANYNRLARGAEAASSLTYWARSKHRWRLAAYGNVATVWLGTNDVPGPATAAQIESYLTTIYQQLRGRMQRIVAVTLPPRTTSTDAFATTVNQTPMPGYEVGGKRDQVNAWIKAQVGGLIDEVIDLNPVFESGKGSGLWVPGRTADGTHPNETGMQVGKGIVSSAASKWVVE